MHSPPLLSCSRCLVVEEPLRPPHHCQSGRLGGVGAEARVASRGSGSVGLQVAGRSRVGICETDTGSAASSPVRLSPRWGLVLVRDECEQ